MHEILITGFIDSSQQKVYLTALTSLISSLPKAVYIGEIPNVGNMRCYLIFDGLIALQLMVYFIQGLELPDNELQKNIISTLSEVANDDGQVSAQDHASTLA